MNNSTSTNIVVNAMKKNNKAELNDLFYTAFSDNLLFNSNINFFSVMNSVNVYHRLSLLTSRLIRLIYYHVSLPHSSMTEEQKYNNDKKKKKNKTDASLKCCLYSISERLLKMLKVNKPLCIKERKSSSKTLLTESLK